MAMVATGGNAQVQAHSDGGGCRGRGTSGWGRAHRQKPRSLRMVFGLRRKRPPPLGYIIGGRVMYHGRRRPLWDTLFGGGYRQEVFNTMAQWTFLSMPRPWGMDAGH